MAVYGLAILWPAGTSADKAADLVGGLKTAFPADKVELIQVARLSDSANLHLRLNLSPYPRPVVEKLMRDVQGAQGRFVELWRMSKEERDSFRTLHLPSGKENPVDAEEAGELARSSKTFWNASEVENSCAGIDVLSPTEGCDVRAGLRSSEGGWVSVVESVTAPPECCFMEEIWAF